jgi:hypothetical protein
MAKHNSKKWKKSSFDEEKSLVGLTPGKGAVKKFMSYSMPLIKKG